MILFITIYEITFFIIDLTPLCEAIMNKNLEIVKILLSYPQIDTNSKLV